MTPRADGEVFRVYLHERAIGTLIRRQDVTRFAFDPDYVRDPERGVLGLRFEENLRASQRAHLRLPAWFSNLLPEGQLREWIGLARGSSPNREMELLAQVGHDLPGAVRVIAAEEVPADPASGDDVSLTSDSTAPALWRFSLAGVGLKFSMLAQGERFMAPAAGEDGDWIVKLPDPSHREVPRNEYAMMDLARSAGIEVPDTRLVHRDLIASLPDRVWPTGEDYAYAVRRFDRAPGRKRVHIEDFAQVRGVYSDLKYSGSFETLAALVYRGRHVDSLREFVRRLAFNVLIGNGDAHLKNWSLIYRDLRVPELSPAYDLVATSHYRPAEQGPENLGLKLGGSRRFARVTLASFGALEARLGAKVGLQDVAATVARDVVRAWPGCAARFEGRDWLREAIGAVISERAAQLGA